MSGDYRDSIIKNLCDAVERLAFEMPPPNDYTPRFVSLAIQARFELEAYRDIVDGDFEAVDTLLPSERRLSLRRPPTHAPKGERE